MLQFTSSSQTTACSMQHHHPAHCRYHSVPHQHTYQRSPARPVQSHAQAAQQQAAVFTTLKSACSTHRAHIGYNAQGFRGLIASEDLAPGDVVVSVPLHNILQVPRKLGSAAAAAAARAALTNWQQQHGQLPESLVDLTMDADCPWEAKLVCRLLHLRHAAQPGSLWSCYCAALPAKQDTLTFFCYSPQQAEQLQFSTWKALAASQRKLLLEVQQHCNRAFSSSSSSSGGVGGTASSSSSLQPSEQDIAWALSMVKSRTFGRTLQQRQQQQQQDPSPDTQTPATATQPPAKPCAADELEVKAEGEEDESNVVLLMVPFVDMINHHSDNNTVFGLDWDNNCFEVTCSSSIAQGSEVTINYGSNKSNLALQSCYGFYIPGNPNDAQLLQPVFNSCLAAAGNIQGFDPELIAAAAGLGQQQQQLDDLQLARRRCAVSALPTAELVAAAAAAAATASEEAAPSRSSSSGKKQLHLQKYLAELIIYQIQQILRLCGTTAEEDAAALERAAAGERGCDAAASSTVSSSGASHEAILSAVVDQAITTARLEQKLLLLECRHMCERLLGLIAQRLQ